MEGGGDQNPFISSTYNKFFLLCHHSPIQCVIHSPTFISVTSSLHIFSQQQCHLTLLAHTSYSSSHYYSGHLIRQYPLILQIPHMSPINAPHLLCQLVPHQCKLAAYFLHLLLLISHLNCFLPAMHRPVFTTSSYSSSKPHTLHTSRILHLLLVYLPLTNLPSSNTVYLLSNISFISPSSFLHPRSSCTATPATILLSPNNVLPILICADSNFLHTLRSPVHHTSAAYSKLPHHPSSIYFSCPFTLLIHVTLPIHSFAFFCHLL